MAERQDSLATRLAALPTAPPLDLICAGAVAFLEVTASAVVLMSGTNGGSVAAAYGPAVTAVDDLQFALGEGPSVTAFTTGEAVFESDLSYAGGRWPAFAPAAVAAGVCAVFAAPVQLGTIRLGVLVLVRDRPGPLTDDGIADMYGLAELATVALLDGHPDGRWDPTQDHRWAHHAVVHQAAGMVSVQLGMGLAESLSRLRARAYVLDRSIYDVAADVVARHLRFTEEEGRGAP